MADGTLSNPKHERVAMAYVQDPGRIGYKAYQSVYPKCSKDAAEVAFSNLLRKTPGFRERITKLEAEIAKSAIGDTAELRRRVLEELQKIAFCDLRTAVKWGVRMIEGREVLTNKVELINSDDIPDDVAGAISEVSQSKDGVKIKFHDKKAALQMLGDHLNLFAKPEDNPLNVTNITLEQIVNASFNLPESVKPVGNGKVIEHEPAATTQDGGHPGQNGIGST